MLFNWLNQHWETKYTMLNPIGGYLSILFSYLSPNTMTHYRIIRTIEYFNMEQPSVAKCVIDVCMRFPIFPYLKFFRISDYYLIAVISTTIITGAAR